MVNFLHKFSLISTRIFTEIETVLFVINLSQGFGRVATSFSLWEPIPVSTIGDNQNAHQPDDWSM